VIDNAEFVELFLKNYSVSKQKLIHLPTSRIITLPYPNIATQSSFIFEHLRIAMTGDPQIYIDTDKITVDQVSEWLSEVSKRGLFDLQLKYP